MTVKSYLTPRSLDEALNLKSQYGAEVLVMAGGTLTMPQINTGNIFPGIVMGLRGASMGQIHVNGGVTIGAAATMTDITTLDGFDILQQAAQSVAGWAIRNMATVGGNLFAFPPFGDFGVALLALNAEVRIQSSKQDRTLFLQDFYASGCQLADDELLTEIYVSPPQGRSAFHKFSYRHSNAPSIVTLALQITLAGGIVSSAQVALSGIGHLPMRSHSAENALLNNPLDASTIEAVANIAAETSDPQSDAIASAWYRRRMIAVQLKRVLTAISA